ncbi:MAG: AAA family ATPase, partial [Planctomycetes bacterium]|nr:AAA family ATPase [Planctomycetota bacterium]
MSLLKQVHTGRRHSPPRIIVYGAEGIGKSTTASQAPKPIFVPTEDGLDQIDCKSFPLAHTLADVEAALQTLTQEQHEHCQALGHVLFHPVGKGSAITVAVFVDVLPQATVGL